MSFMRPMIYKGDFYLIDGDNGTDFVPGDLADIDLLTGETLTEDDPGFRDAVEQLRDFIESPRGIQSIERHMGFYGRYSAPGYSDATDYVWGSTEEKVRATLEEMYGDDSEEPA